MSLRRQSPWRSTLRLETPRRSCEDQRSPVAQPSCGRFRHPRRSARSACVCFARNRSGMSRSSAVPITSLLGVAEDALGTLVEDRDALMLVDRDDRVGGDGDDSGELGLGQAQRLLRPFALRNVFDLRDVVERRAVRPAKDRATEHDVDDRSVFADVALLELVSRDVAAGELRDSARRPSRHRRDA